jgi:hypothetical protein
MKKIILLFIVAFALNSCTTEDNTQHVTYELLPIQSCQMPYEFVYGQTYELQMFFKKPTSCHFYKGIYFEKQEGNTRIVAIQSGVVESNSCVPYDDNTNELLTTTSTKCNFKVTGHENYIFKFWTGKNEQGENTYYEVEVPVDN